MIPVLGAVVDGIEAHPIRIEVQIRNGLPRFELVGLADKSVREARVRVRGAFGTVGIAFPEQEIVSINLSPGRIPKAGTGLDLPIGVAIAAAVGERAWPRLADHVLVGELGMDGRVLPVAGVLPIAIECRRRGVAGLIVAPGNAAEAASIEDLAVFPAATLGQALAYLAGEGTLERATPPASVGPPPRPRTTIDDVRGQLQAKRALEIAAAGNHNVLLVGPPGAGKTLLASALPGLLPPLSREEAIEVTKVHSVAGMVSPGAGLVGVRPFRAPHHTVSREGLVGGGSTPRPGEVALAHLGVLFLDEMAEFKRDALECLRQPLESGSVRVVRKMHSVEFPARFLLVGAMNPCPCGHYFGPSGACRCTPYTVSRYQSRVSGPLIDRIDLHVLVDKLPMDDLYSRSPSDPDAEAVAVKVANARRRQRERHGGDRTNAGLSGTEIRRIVRLDPPARRILANAMTEMGLSARAHDRILKVARTIADLDGAAEVASRQILEAVQFRKLDKALV